MLSGSARLFMTLPFFTRNGILFALVHDYFGGNMIKVLFIIGLMITTHLVSAADCFELAGRDYKIDPDLLRAIAWHESKFKTHAIGLNPKNGYGSGLMQVDSQHFPELKTYGIKPEHLRNDACLNIYTGAYYLAIAFSKWGVSWNAVGAYNAGFKKSERQEKRRRIYVEKIYPVYMAYKKMGAQNKK